MTPAVKALTELIRALEEQPDYVPSAEEWARVCDLSGQAAQEDPLTVAFERAQAGFRKREGR